jgi:hypothetical protein
MKLYLLTLYQPDGPAPAPEALAAIMREVSALREEMKASGAYVFSGGLHAPSAAAVVRLKDREIVSTDGPYIETKEYVGGLTIIRAADLEVALEFGRRLAHATQLPIEVRPFQDGAG